MSMVSIIVPVYNEDKVLEDCISSLKKQSEKNFEIIVVDDGSTDSSRKIAKQLGVKILEQKHKGPGNARNLGAKQAKGDILVFADADMTFDKNFVKDLVAPIKNKEAIGTFSKNEYVSNKNNPWSVCWNINRNTPSGKMLPDDYPDEAPVYRAILKKEFDKVGGFDISGDYTDDWSLSEKLGIKSKLAPRAVYYHNNPSNIGEVWSQAMWIGKNKFLTGNFTRKIRSIFLYSFPISFFIAILKSAKNLNPLFFIFKLIYDLAVFIAVLKSFMTVKKLK